MDARSIYSTPWRLLGATPLLAVLALGGCGSSSPPRDSSASRTSPNFSTRHNDRDNDGDHNNDDEKVLGFGHAADAADYASSVALVKRYFADAAAKNGADGCRLLVPFIAETTAQEDGESPELKGTTCPVVLSKLFAQHQPLLQFKSSTLRVIGVRVEGNRALAVLDFPKIPEVRQIGERRVGGRWLLLDLFDGIIE